MNHEAYLIGKKPFRHVWLGLSIAASWAWGVSIIVGMQVIQQKGLGAFLIWAAANALTLLVFGFLIKKVGQKTIQNIMPAGAQPVYKVLTLTIQFFSLLVNLTAIKLAMSILGVTWAWTFFAALILAIVLIKGFSGSVKGDIVQLAIWMFLMVGALCLAEKTSFAVAQSNIGQLQWALWGAVILFAAPIVDLQMWQRKESMRHTLSIKPFVVATIVFAIYMVFVGLFGIYNLNTPAVTAGVILFVAGSTLLSALSAISIYGKNIKQSRYLMTIFLATAALAMLFNASILSLWLVYGSVRVPFSAYLVYLILKRGNG
ncbi:MAG: hypothetical protein WA125_17490 [Desulfosporosinus sp.]